MTKISPGDSSETTSYEEWLADLLQETQRKLILAITGIYMLWLFSVGLRMPEFLNGPFWIVFTAIVAVSWLSHQMLQRTLRISQLVWLGGLVLVNLLAIFLFRSPEIALFYMLLPLLAVLMRGRYAGLLAEGVVIALMSWLRFVPWASGVEPFAVIAIAGGAISGVLGLITSDTLITEYQNSRYNFQLARQSRDETRQHRAQLMQLFQDLDKAYYRLERANAALVAAWREANEARHQKEQFTTYISHEMRTPLNLIAGFSEMILTSPDSYGSAPLPGLYRGDVNKIYQNAQHLLSLVDDVIDLARANINKIPLTREYTDLAGIIVQSAEMVGDYIRTKGLELRLDVPDPLPQLYLDRLRIRQVLLNLLVNATRFTKKGQITIRVSLTSGDVAGELVRVEVIDTGHGIPPNELPHIFEGYHTMDQYDSAWHSGSGLGLPISKALIELHGGTMGVHSVLNQGSTFWFSLPIAPVPAVEKPTQYSYTVMPYFPPATERVAIVIHPDARVAVLLQRYLSGCRLINAPTVEAGLIAAQENNAIAIIVEPDTEVLTTNAHLMIFRAQLPTNQKIAKRLGTAAFLWKPVSNADLIEAVQRVHPKAQNLLIVDDEIEVQQLFRRMLAARFPAENCRTAANGLEALEMIETQRPDVILLDLQMPEMNGYQTLAVMAAQPELASIPVIVISGELQDDQMRLDGEISIARGGGLAPEELGAALGAVITTLSPGWSAESTTLSKPEIAPVVSGA